MTARLFAFVLAGALVAPQTAVASESEFNNDVAAVAATRLSQDLPLPPIPYLDTMPWMGIGAKSNGPGIGTFLMRDFDGPAILKSSAMATNQFGNAEAQFGKTPAN
ncbi:hypothetical protein [Bradyrhizobium sp.]|uniref:hypothetical protein n=1 Tax=Bradyrhizobium sp. TaxID=376 RepID=UPI0027362BE8|nr:hypothetical protein [Bradyrhizobium sp.]MDP3692772.1 hypothetical protein [Bradyrhizobium sp.]